MPEIKWSAPEFDYYEKSRSWYYASVAIALLILAFSIWQKNYLFGFFVIIAETLILSWAGKKPEMLDFTLDEKGLTVGESKFYPYAEIKSFGPTNMDSANQGFMEIIIYFQRRLRPSMLIRLPKDKAADIQLTLGKKVPEVEVELTLIDAIERLIRF